MCDKEQSQKMLIALADYMRYTVLATKKPYSTLQQELSNIERYLAIEKFRFNNKLLYQFDINNACAFAQIPSMLLQPLFENAVKHGMYDSLQPIFISTKAEPVNNDLVLTISNDYDVSPPPQKQGTGTGLNNIRERLWLCYGNAAVLHTKIRDGKFFVSMIMPLRIAK
jgi:LytS/YehU family sensor histidine kinase